MSRRNEAAYWDDMLDTARAIEERISTATRRDLDVNVDFRLALMYRASPSDRARILENRFGSVTRDIPDLLTALSRILPSDPP